MTISRGRTERLYQADESKADQKRIGEEIIFVLRKTCRKNTRGRSDILIYRIQIYSY